jgi:hypothetical protein
MGRASARKRHGGKASGARADYLATSTADIRRRHSAGLLECDVCGRSISPNERSGSCEILGSLLVVCHEHVPVLEGFLAEAMEEASARGIEMDLRHVDGRSL